MPLTDSACKNAKPSEKPRKLSDSAGLYLEVMPSGSKYWRMKYRFAGKEKRLAFGVYPETSLAEARERRDQARKILANGHDPAEAKKEQKRQTIIETKNSFETLAREWHENNLPSWTETYAKRILGRLEADIFPALGARPISAINAPELLEALRAIEKRGAIELAHRALQMAGQVFRYAIATGRAERDISSDLRGALKTRKVQHHAKLSADELPEFFSRLESYDGDLQTKLALKFLVLTFVRTGELRGARWEELNLEKAEWRIPAERMKMRDPHIVPLSRQAVAVLEELKEMNGYRDHVFPNTRKPTGFISENTILFALYRMGYRHKATGHGFRATASTVLNEHGFRPDVIERQLAHSERNKVRAAYNHAEYLPERRKMMQWWADFIDNMMGNGKVIAGKFGETTHKQGIN
jgi:integrase